MPNFDPFSVGAALGTDAGKLIGEIAGIREPPRPGDDPVALLRAILFTMQEHLKHISEGDVLREEPFYVDATARSIKFAGTNNNWLFCAAPTILTIDSNDAQNQQVTLNPGWTAFNLPIGSMVRVGTGQAPVVLTHRRSNQSPGGSMSGAGGSAATVIAEGSDSSSTTTTIASGTSLSPLVDLGANQRLSRIIIPSGWTAASITLQASIDGLTWFNLYTATDAAGTTQEYTIGVAVTTGLSVLVPVADFAGIRYLRVRSGTSTTPVNQSADRVLTLITRTVA